MKIAIVGGGPGGLYLSALLKRTDPTRDVIVFDRNPVHADYGFGVVFSDNTLSSLERHDPGMVDDLAALGPSWNDIQVERHGDVIRCGGIGFTSIGRVRLLQHLTGLAAGAGVELRFEVSIGGPADLPASDLVVGADGANSTVRSWSPEEFGYHPEVGDAKFIWLGTTKLYDCLTFQFREGPDGAFGVHAYPFDEGTSTFLVETDDPSLRAAGLDRFDPGAFPPGASDERSVAYIAELFHEELGGHRLLASNSKWLSFATVRNDRWWAGRTVLIGDAAHTAHFSVGSGTRMAMEDALALSRAIDREPDVEAALLAYEQERRPEVERIQEAAAPSQRWWERFQTRLDWDLEPFAFHFLTRTPRITRDSLTRRDISFVRAIDDWWGKSTDLVPRGQTRLAAPLLASLDVLGLRIPNRVSVTPSLAPGGSPVDHLVEVGGLARCGAGLIRTGPSSATAAGAPSAGLSEDHLDAWTEIVRFVHEHSPAAIALRCAGACLVAADAPEVAERAHRAGFDVLELDLRDHPADGDDLAELVSAYRAAWPDELPLAVGLEFVVHRGFIDEERSLARAEAAAAGDVDLVALSLPPAAPAGASGRDRWRGSGNRHPVRLPP